MQERIEQALRRDAIDQALALAREWADSAPDEAAAQRALAVVLARAGDPEAARVARTVDRMPPPARAMAS